MSNAAFDPAEFQRILDEAKDQALIGKASQGILAAPNVGAAVNLQLIPDMTLIESSGVAQVTFVLDDSGSMFNVEDIVRQGFNEGLTAIEESQDKDTVLVSTHRLNSGMLHGFRTLQDAERLDTNNYFPHGGTPLIDAVHLAVTGGIGQWLTLNNAAYDSRVILAIFTDGAENASKHSFGDVRPLIEDLIRNEYVVFGVGMGDDADFRSTFKKMGLRERDILVVGYGINDTDAYRSEIRKMFGMVSKKISQATSSAANISQMAQGGFFS